MLHRSKNLWLLPFAFLLASCRARLTPTVPVETATSSILSPTPRPTRLAVTATATTVPTTSPTPTPYGQIAFASQKDRASNIYIVDTQGKVVQLTKDLQIANRSPRWSPDGKKLAFFSSTFDDENWMQHTSLRVINHDGTSLRTLPIPNIAGSFAWSPDGDRIAFESKGDLYTVDVESLSLTQLTKRPADDTFPEWSPDAQRIVFTSDQEGGFDVYVMEMNNFHISRLTHFLNEYPIPASWSPDGKKLVLVVIKTSKIASIFVINPDGTRLTDLTKDTSSSSFAAVWSPDSERIAFVSDRDGNYEIYTINADGSGLTRLTDDPALDQSPAWSPDGKQLAFESDRTGGSEIFIMNDDGTAQKRLTFFESISTAPQWRPKIP